MYLMFNKYFHMKPLFTRRSETVFVILTILITVVSGFFLSKINLTHDFLELFLNAERGVLLTNSLSLALLLLVWRFVYVKWLHTERENEKVLIIGSGDLAKKVGDEIFDNEELGLKLVGFIDEDLSKINGPVINSKVIGRYDDIKKLVHSKKISRIIVALADRRSKLPMSVLLECKMSGMQIEEGVAFHERVKGKIPIDQLKPSWIVFSNGFKLLMPIKILKRAMDIFFSIILILLSIPIFLIFPLLIKLDSRGSIFFKQIRVGENGKEFEIYKFRSMKQDAEVDSGPVWAGLSDKRVTRIGRIIRKLRIDELPQLYNVIKGEMSFIGPRPERPYFVEKLQKQIPYYKVRTAIKPGITGWTQIKYPYGATFNDAIEKLQYDMYYIKNMSPLLDILILFWTIKVVLTGKGAR